MKLLATLVLLGVAAPGMQAQAQEAATDRVTLTLSPQKKTYLELEPVRLLVKVENKTGKDLTLPSDPFDPTVLTILVAAGSGEFVPYHPAGLPWGSPIPTSKVLKNGESDSGIVTVYHKTVAPADGKSKVSRVFPKVGKYRCKVRLASLDATVVSEEATVEIVAGDDAAVTFLKEKDLDKFLADEGGALTPKDVEGADAFLRTFPGSRYEKYLHYGLGRAHYTQSQPGGDRKETDKGTLQIAAILLAKAAADKDNPFGIEAAFYAGSAYSELQETKLARLYLQAVQSSRVEPYARQCLSKLAHLDLIEKSEKRR